MSNTETTASTTGGIGFFGLLTIVFITLKLTGYITWSWIWVLSPLWITFAAVVAIIALVGVIALIVIGLNKVADNYHARKDRKARG